MRLVDDSGSAKETCYSLADNAPMTRLKLSGHAKPSAFTRRVSSAAARVLSANDSAIGEFVRKNSQARLTCKSWLYWHEEFLDLVLGPYALSTYCVTRHVCGKKSIWGESVLLHCSDSRGVSWA